MKHLLPVCNCVFLYSIQNHFCDNLMSADDFGLLMYGSISNKEQFVWISWTNTDAEVLHTLLPLLPKHQHVIESNTLQWHCARFNWFGVKKAKPAQWQVFLVEVWRDVFVKGAEEKVSGTFHGGGKRLDISEHLIKCCQDFKRCP